jgi:hypothetical protein
MFYIVKLGFIALLLDDEEQFQSEHVRTERSMRVHSKEQKNGKNFEHYLRS